MYKLAIIDGIISGKPENKSTLNIPAVEFGEGGSDLIEAMQKEFGVPAKYRDRIITDPSMLVEYMQDHYGTTKDRYISMPSNVIKKWQKVMQVDVNKIRGLKLPSLNFVVYVILYFTHHFNVLGLLKKFTHILHEHIHE